MRRSINEPRSASKAASLAISRQGSMARRATSTDENNPNHGSSTNGKGEKSFMEDAQHGFSASGPVTARLKALEKKYSQLLEMQAKFHIIDKWIQQQFGIKLFPPAVVNSEKFAEGNPDDVDNPFYAVYLSIQRIKLLEDKVKLLESRPVNQFETRPTSNYSSAHAFRNFKGKPSGGSKRAHGGTSSASTTPKKAKLAPRPSLQPSASPLKLKPSVKILSKNVSNSPIKKEKDELAGQSTSSGNEKSPAKVNPDMVVKVEETITEPSTLKSTEESKKEEPCNSNASNPDKSDNEQQRQDTIESTEPRLIEEQASTAAIVGEANDVPTDTTPEVAKNSEVVTSDGNIVAEKIDDTNIKETKQSVTDEMKPADIKMEVEDPDSCKEDMAEGGDDDGKIPILEDSTVHDTAADAEMVVDSAAEDEDAEVELKPEITIEDDTSRGGDVSGSEASVSSISSTNRNRSSTRRQAAAVVAPLDEKDEKPVMYTTRGRRQTVPRRYAEFTGHDNVASILKSQQRAEKSAGGSSGKPGRKPGTSKNQDATPKTKKSAKTTSKTPSAKKLHSQTPQDSDAEDVVASSSKRKPGMSASLAAERPPCVDALVEMVMAREVDHDGMVQLTESFPNIYVNQQQLVAVIVRANGKATRLTRKMTTLVFEDSLLASASPFGTKYYKDRLPPEPLEAMVDFIAGSGFEPQYTKKKIYMIVGQVCNEARAGRVSKHKFVQPLEGGSTAGPSEMPPSEGDDDDDEFDSTLPASPLDDEFSQEPE